MTLRKDEKDKELEELKTASIIENFIFDIKRLAVYLGRFRKGHIEKNLFSCFHRGRQRWFDDIVSTVELIARTTLQVAS